MNLHIHLLGYKNGDAFRQAACRGTVSVATFKRKGFRVRFAHSHDIAKWLVSLDQDPKSFQANGYIPACQD